MSSSGPPTPHAQSSDDAAPTGWGVAAASASASAAPADSHYSSRVGNRKLRSLPEVQRHLKHDVGEANCNADELLWLQTLERYGTSFAKHWAVAFGMATCTQKQLESGQLPAPAGAAPLLEANTQAQNALEELVASA